MVASICRRRLGGGGRREAVGAINALVDGAVLAKMAQRLLGWCLKCRKEGNVSLGLSRAVGGRCWGL